MERLTLHHEGLTATSYDSALAPVGALYRRVAALAKPSTSESAPQLVSGDLYIAVYDLIRDGFQPRLPTSLPPPGQQQQPSPLPRRQPVPLMPPAQLHTGAPRVVAPAPAVPLQSPPPSELMDVDPSAGPPSQAVAVQPVLQPLSLGTPKESDTAAPCPAPTQQPSTQRQETLPLFVGPDAPSRPVPEAAPVVTGVHPDLGFQSVFPEAPRSQCWGADRRLPPTTVSAPVSSATPAA
ncbi:uncharacterized protein LOC126214910 [Schistocerca nitens]|uniref:uncharacterized protein LOC126214910 n=1 Tax=Schistocerca nitens TaxID=7011 RepID=UPI002118E7A6|nr:uncharacterized protein LOC126214910 [Schistocerca nitens]